MLVACGSSYANDDAKDSDHGHMATHRDFDAVDSKHRGYVTTDDVRSDAYARDNFDKCNMKHDGHMNRSEYEGCHE
jgi:hypothetical protein